MCSCQQQLRYWGPGSRSRLRVPGRIHKSINTDGMLNVKIIFFHQKLSIANPSGLILIQSKHWVLQIKLVSKCEYFCDYDHQSRKFIILNKYAILILCSIALGSGVPAHKTRIATWSKEKIHIIFISDSAISISHSPYWRFLENLQNPVCWTHRASQ